MRAGIIGVAFFLSGCNLGSSDNAPISGDGVIQAPASGTGETGIVTNVIDGDTIDVRINGSEYRIRYIGVNTPERDESCYAEATAANLALVTGQTVTLVRDVNETDRYGRLLRYVYVGDLNVNATLVSQGWAEAVEYPPDTAQTASFRDLERAAAGANRGCHPTGIINDGNDVR